MDNLPDSFPQDSWKVVLQQGTATNKGSAALAFSILNGCRNFPDSRAIPQTFQFNITRSAWNWSVRMQFESLKGRLRPKWRSREAETWTRHTHGGSRWSSLEVKRPNRNTQNPKGAYQTWPWPPCARARRRRGRRPSPPAGAPWLRRATARQ